MMNPKLATGTEGALPAAAMAGEGILPDVLAPGLDVVFRSTAAGARSAERGAYYAGPGNRFWPILHRTGLTPRQLAPEEFRQVTACGIGLADLAKRVAGPDRSHLREDYDLAGLLDRLRREAPGLRVLACNGKRAGAAYLLGDARRTARVAVGGPQPDPHRAAGSVFVLPSTSDGGCRYWREGPWHDLARHLGRGPPGLTS